MGWNYRATRESIPVAPDSEETVYRYAIRELFYDKDGNVNGWSDEEVAPTGDTWNELVEDLNRIALASRIFDTFDIDTREWIKPNRRGE